MPLTNAFRVSFYRALAGFKRESRSCQCRRLRVNIDVLPHSRSLLFEGWKSSWRHDGATRLYTRIDNLRARFLWPSDIFSYCYCCDSIRAAIIILKFTVIRHRIHFTILLVLQFFWTLRLTSIIDSEFELEQYI